MVILISGGIAVGVFVVLPYLAARYVRRNLRMF